VFDKHRNVVAPFPERRHFYFDDVQAVVEVLPEAAFLYPERQVGIRRRDDPDIDIMMRVSPTGVSLIWMATTCSDSDISPISSRNSVPGSPLLMSRLMAEVNEGIAPQDRDERRMRGPVSSACARPAGAAVAGYQDMVLLGITFP
jgi:hypothetical protein